METQKKLDDFKQVLKQKGLKATPQRIAVHTAMLQMGHASADMVVEKLRESETHTTVASVYNNLSQLADIGIYHRRLSSNNKMYFDVNTFRHYHLYDRVNNSYRDIVDEELIKAIDCKFKGKKFRGYSVERVDVQIVCRPTRKYRRN